MASKAVPVFCAFSMILTLSSCEHAPTKEQLGGAIGAVTGAVIGNRVADEHKDAWMAVGAVTGTFIGSRIGRYLDDQDKQRMAQSTQQAAVSGQTQKWENTTNKTSGEASVVATETKAEPVTVRVLKKKVTQVPPLNIIGQTYRAKGTSNLRGGPGTDYEVVGNLAEGEAVNVVGKVKTSDWYLVSRDGVGSGFVESSLVEQAPTQTPASSGKPIKDSEVAEQQVNSTRTCRMVKQTVKLADGSSQTETIQACQGPNGWETKA